MRIVPGQSIAGVDLVGVRDALRRLKDRTFPASSVTDRFDLDPDAAERLIEALVEQGFLEPDPDRNQDQDRWRLTVQGNALTNATAARPVKRTTAARALAGLLERAEQINADDELAYQVDEIVVFGSYLDPDAEVVGDVDVAIGLSPRYEGDELQRRSDARIDAAARSGRRFPNFVEQIAWPQLELLHLLKGGSRVLSLTTIDDRILDTAGYEGVFLREGASARWP